MRDSANARRDNDGVGALLERLGVNVPVVQAGMGGGLAGHELAAAVSAAGGLGTIGILSPEDFHREIVAARLLSDRPLAVNLLLRFARRGHFETASEADVVVTFWGSPKRQTSKVWIHQCGSVEEALATREAGADAVIAQGVEAGGHVRGTVSAMELSAHHLADGRNGLVKRSRYLRAPAKRSLTLGLVFGALEDLLQPRTLLGGELAYEHLRRTHRHIQARGHAYWFATRSQFPVKRFQETH